ncbi:hypothetical protein OQA88_9084 [Cercophora sp. LCS_1]
MSLTFRLATPTDASQLQPLVQSAYRGDSSRAGWTTEADLLGGERIDVDGIISKIARPNAAVIIATDPDGILTACCEVERKGTERAYFGMFAVDPKRQAGGFGRQVLQYAEEWCAREWGTKKMEMSVIWTRAELIAWYERRGYKKTGETRAFPWEELGEQGWALRGKEELDLYFEVLEKEIGDGEKGKSEVVVGQVEVAAVAA